MKRLNKEVVAVVAGVLLSLGMTFAFVEAAPGGNGGGPGNDGGCGQGKAAGDCVPDNGDECSNGQHSGNPHCGGDETPAPTPSATPSPEPTVTPTVVPTVVPENVDETQPSDDPVDPPTVAPTQVPAVVDLSKDIVLDFDLVSPPWTDERPVVQPVFTFGNYPQPTFDVSTITALPHAGDGSASEETDGGRAVKYFLVALVCTIAGVSIGMKAGK